MATAAPDTCFGSPNKAPTSFAAQLTPSQQGAIWQLAIPDHLCWSLVQRHIWVVIVCDEDAEGHCLPELATFLQLQRIQYPANWTYLKLLLLHTQALRPSPLHGLLGQAACDWHFQCTYVTAANRMSPGNWQVLPRAPAAETTLGAARWTAES